MSGDVTRPMQSPTPYPAYQPGRPRRGPRWPFIVLGALVVVLLLLVGLDRVAAAVAANRAASQMQTQGFPVKPDVTMEGFPFLTQVLARNLQDVHISASGVKEGPVTLSMTGDARGVRLNPGYQSGTITTVNGTVVVGFSSIANAARAAGAPGVTVSAAGPHQVKLKVDLQVFTTTAIASISQTGPSTFRVHIISAGGLPASLLGSLGDFSFSVPKLPYGLTIQSVNVTSQGVVGTLTAHNLHFSQ